MQQVVELQIDCPGPKPATQEPREWQVQYTGDGALPHGFAYEAAVIPKGVMVTQDLIQSALWDRLRADLHNLGAAYGPITEGVCEAVATPEPVDIMQRDGETLHDWFNRLWSMREKNKTGHASDPSAPRPVTSLDSDRNAYFDGIILAARKKREREYGSLIYDPMSDNGHEWSWNTDACAHCGLTSTEIVENGDEHGDVRCDGGKARNGRLTLSAAMSRPLDFEPRVGHKGVEIDE